MYFDLFLVAIGLAALLLGAEALVRGANSIAHRYGVPKLIIGLTIVAFGTSAPELCVSLIAAFKDSADVAIGNVVGSNIFNIMVIVALAAVFRPLVMPRAAVWREMPIMLATLGLFYVASFDGIIDLGEGIVFFLGILAYLVMNYFLARRGKVAAEHLPLASEIPEPVESKKLFPCIVLIIVGLLGMVFGAEWIVRGATAIARDLGVAEIVIAVSLVALGTSLPELATTMVAAFRGHPELAVGNAIGSNIFNVLSVIGISAWVTPLHVNPQALAFDYPVMMAGCVVAWPLMFIQKKMGRWQGAVLLLGYLGYLYFLFA